MASQNLPGFAVLRASGYRDVPTRSILAVTGLASILTAPLGAHTSNLAAISAAICTGPDTHPDPAKRWMAGPFYALELRPVRGLRRRAHRTRRRPSRRTHQDGSRPRSHGVPSPAPWASRWRMKESVSRRY